MGSVSTNAELSAYAEAAPEADEAADDLAASRETNRRDGVPQNHAIAFQRGSADGGPGFLAAQHGFDELARSTNLINGIGEGGRFPSTDNFAYAAVSDAADPVADHAANLCELQVPEGFSEFFPVAAGHRVYDTAQAGFLVGQPRDRMRKLVQARKCFIGLRRPAKLETSKHTQLDAYHSQINSQ
jgi:hypothetical protein